MNWIENFHEEHPDSIENFDNLMLDLKSINLREVSLDFKNKEDIRSYNELGSIKISNPSYSGEGDVYYEKYHLSNADGRGNDGYVTIARSRLVSIGNGDDAIYDLNHFEGCPELYKKVFERTGGCFNFRKGVDRKSFISRCLLGNVGGIGRELYKKNSQEVFKDLYDDRLYDLESEYGKDSQEVKKFKKFFKGVDCMELQSVVDNGYTDYSDSPLDGGKLKMLNVDKDFIYDAMWR